MQITTIQNAMFGLNPAMGMGVVCAVVGTGVTVQTLPEPQQVTITIRQPGNGEVEADAELLGELAELERVIDANAAEADRRVKRNTQKLTGKESL